MGDGHRVVDRRAVEAVAPSVELEEEVGELRDRLAAAAGTAQPLGVRRVEERLVRDVEPDHRHLDAAPEHGRRRLGIDERVELRRRRDVALADRASHPDDPLEPVADVGMALEHERDVRQRAGRDENDVGLDQLGQEVGRVRSHSGRRRLRQGRAVEPALAVDVRGRAQLAPS